MNVLYKSRLPLVVDDNMWYLFSPYQAKLLVVNASDMDSFKQKIECFEPSFMGEPRNPYSETSIKRFVFVVTSACNLHCNYCYAVEQQFPLWMDKEMPISILNKSLCPNTETLFISFFGGEPTLNMEAISNTVTFLKKLGIRTYFRINTNGVMESSILDYLVDNRFKIIISNDGSPFVNRLHRKRLNEVEDVWSSKITENSIKRLADSNADFRVRCTITKDNIYNLEESIQYWKSLNVEYVHLEPINPQNQEKNLMDLLPPVEEFVYYFKKAIDMAEKVGIWVTTGIYMNLLTPSTYFCTTSTGEYLVYNPDGSISNCYRVQNKNHEQKEFIVANRLDDYFKEKKTEHKYGYIPVDSFRECKVCMAKYICGGGCLMRNKIHAGAKAEVDSWTCKVKTELLKDAILRIYNSYEKNKTPLIFGQFMFEKKAFENPSIGENTFCFSNSKEIHNNNYHLKQMNDGVKYIDICEMLNLKGYDLRDCLKLSRSECF